MTTTRYFDGTRIETTDEDVTVTENGISLTLVKSPSLYTDAVWNVAGLVRAGSATKWEADRIAYCFSLAARWGAAA